VICATTTPDNPFPATACHIAHDIGARRAGGFDVNAACSGFVFAMNAASQFVACGTYKKVLVIGTEKLSSILDWTDRNTCILFGDGAGAVVLEPLEQAGRGEFLSTSIHMEGGHDEDLRVVAGGSRLPASLDTIEQRLHFIKMGGNRIFKFAVKTFAELVETAVAPHGYEQLGVIVPHQVNQRIIESAVDRLAIPRELIFANIHKYGNTAAASVPLALDEAVKEGRCRKGFLVCMVAFGGGLTWGHTLLRW
jgi:3-oxoacyl-[acyl-carrier-protein] synthase-3